MAHYLITGGAGFIGSHLAETLMARGHRVTVVDDLSTGSLENLRGLADEPGLRFVHGDAADAKLLASCGAHVDGFFHLAAVVGVRRVMENPLHTYETNTRLTDAVIGAALMRCTPVLLASSSEVYGQGPFEEQAVVTPGPASSPRWCYAVSKLAGEAHALAACRESGLPVVVARLFNTAGPRQTGRYGMVVPRLVRQALSGQPLTVYGDGRQTRCFVHVQEAAPALADLLDCTRARGQVVNVGSRHEISIHDLAHVVLRVTGSSSTVVRVPYTRACPPGFEDVARRVPDTARIGRLLGWEALLPIERIVADVAAALSPRLHAAGTAGVEVGHSAPRP